MPGCIEVSLPGTTECGRFREPPISVVEAANNIINTRGNQCYDYQSIKAYNLLFMQESIFDVIESHV